MLDWAQLDRDKVERVAQLLVRAACGATSIDGSGGDLAQDLRHDGPDGLTIFEIKSFAQRLTSSHKRQITRSCKRALQLHQPRRWVLVVPLNPSPAELAWFDGLRAQFPDVEFEWYGIDWLDRQIAGDEGLISYIEGADYQLLRRAKQIGLEREALTSGDQLISRMDDLQRLGEGISPNWKWRFGDTPWGPGHILTAQRPEAADEDPVEFTPLFSFPPDDPEAQATAERLNRALRLGGGVDIPGDYVEELRVAAASGATQRLMGNLPSRSPDSAWRACPRPTAFRSEDPSFLSTVPVRRGYLCPRTTGPTARGEAASSTVSFSIRALTSSMPSPGVEADLADGKSKVALARIRLDRTSSRPSCGTRLETRPITSSGGSAAENRSASAALTCRSTKNPRQHLERGRGPAQQHGPLRIGASMPPCRSALRSALRHGEPAGRLLRQSGHRSPLMYARVVVYTHHEDKVELEAKARAGVIPIVTSTPGYISYGVMFEDDRVVSISLWESEEHAKAADAALAEWVKANTTMTSETRITGDLAWLELASR